MDLDEQNIACHKKIFEFVNTKMPLLTFTFYYA